MKRGLCGRTMRGGIADTSEKHRCSEAYRLIKHFRPPRRAKRVGNYEWCMTQNHQKCARAGSSQPSSEGRVCKACGKCERAKMQRGSEAYRLIKHFRPPRRAKRVGNYEWCMTQNHHLLPSASRVLSTQSTFTRPWGREEIRFGKTQWWQERASEEWVRV